MEAKGVNMQASPYTVGEVMDRLQTVLQQNGVTIYARIDQQAELTRTGLTIPPLEFILFGNPKAGGPIMAENPLAALDLPLKIIAWEDAAGNTWVAYNDAHYVEHRYALTPALTGPLNLEPLVSKVLDL